MTRNSIAPSPLMGEGREVGEPVAEKLADRFTAHVCLPPGCIQRHQHQYNASAANVKGGRGGKVDLTQGNRLV